ncbi:MAG TPA: GDP-L-fucose synthase [Terriglobia bacterium]|nr:GDP-L-fucose synthase [Terriglobia bacterium]
MTAPYNLDGKRVWVAGHRGMVGSAVSRRLERAGARLVSVTREELDLRRQAAVEDWMASTRPEAVIIAAATVGGIEANRTRPAEFLYDNLAIAANIIHAAAETGVEKLMALSSACVYPREAAQPIREDSLLTGPFEPTNEAYAVAKLAALKLCQAYRQQHGKDFIAVSPTNLFGPGDNFDPAASHVIPAMILKTHNARTTGGGPVEIWGSGSPRREFLYVDDAADALVFLMERYSEADIINVGGGEDVSIRELAELTAEVTGYTGGFRFDTSRPDGMPRKALDASRILGMGWKPFTSLRDGLAKTVEWFLANPEMRRSDRS